MKRFLVITVLFVVVMSVAANAQNNNQRDVIYLQSGSTVKGQVIEKRDDGGVRVRTGDGHVYNFDGKEVQRIEKEQPKSNQNNSQNGQNNQNRQRNQNNNPTTQRYEMSKNADKYTGKKRDKNLPTNQGANQQNKYQSKQSERRNTFKGNKQEKAYSAGYASEGYRYFVELGILPGVMCDDSDDQEYTSRIMLSTTHGYQLSSYSFIGGGVGAQFLFHNKEVAITPYIDYRYDFFADVNSPYIGARAGGYIHKGGSGGMFDLMVGYHFGRVNLTIGYELAPYKYQTSIYDEVKYYSSFLFRFSLDWGGGR